MNVESSAAEQILRIELQLTEFVVKLAAKGAVNLAALLIAVLRNEKQITGKTNIMNMIQDGKPLITFPLSAEKMKDFADLTQKYGVAFSIVRDKNHPDTVDVIIREEDAQRVNTVREKIGATAEVHDVKKAEASLSGSELTGSKNIMQHGLASTRTTTDPPQNRTDDLLNRLQKLHNALDYGADPQKCRNTLREIQDELGDMLGLPRAERTAARDEKGNGRDGQEKSSLKREKSRGEEKQSVRSKIANIKERITHEPQHLKQPKAPQPGKNMMPSDPGR